MLRKIYLGVGAVLITSYATASILGWEFFSAQQRKVDPSEIRSRPGGYRSFHFWHTGYRGGK